MTKRIRICCWALTLLVHLILPSEAAADNPTCASKTVTDSVKASRQFLASSGAVMSEHAEAIQAHYSVLKSSYQNTLCYQYACQLVFLGNAVIRLPADRKDSETLDFINEVLRFSAACNRSTLVPTELFPAAELATLKQIADQLNTRKQQLSDQQLRTKEAEAAAAAGAVREEKSQETPALPQVTEARRRKSQLLKRVGIGLLVSGFAIAVAGTVQMGLYYDQGPMRSADVCDFHGVDTDCKYSDGLLTSGGSFLGAGLAVMVSGGVVLGVGFSTK